MKTSGDDAPPEIVVMRLARLVSVSVGADWSLTWMFGYTFSKALISTVRGSGLEVVIGLAHQVMLPLVAEPLAEGAAAGLDVPLLHAAAVSAAVTPMAVISTTRDLPRIAATTFMVLSFLSLSCHVTRSLLRHPHDLDVRQSCGSLRRCRSPRVRPGPAVRPPPPRTAPIWPGFLSIPDDLPELG